MAGFVACHQPVFVDRYDLLEHAAPDGVFLLNTPGAAGSGLGQLAAEDARTDSRQAPAAVGDRRLRRRCGSRHGPAHQHHHADLLLRHLRHPAEGRGDCRDQARGRQDLRQEEPSPGGTELPCHRHDACGAAPGRHSAGGSHRKRVRAGTGRCDGCGHSRLRARPHPADLPGPWRSPSGVPDARRRHLSARHRAIRETHHRAGDSGVGCGSVHPVRQVRVRLPAQRDPRARLRRRRRRRMRRRPSSTFRRRARTFLPAPTSATRWRRRTAPAAATASKPARSTTSRTSAGAR